MPTFILRNLNQKYAMHLFNTAKNSLSACLKLQSRAFSYVPYINDNNTNLLTRDIHKKQFSTSLYQRTQETLAALQIKKRPIRKKRLQDEDPKVPGLFNVMTYSTAEEYDLDRLMQGLRQQDLYEPKLIENNLNAVHAVAKYQVGHEPRELFFFQEGSVVLWNTNELESSNVLSFLKQYEQDSYRERIVQDEAEYVNYKHHTNSAKPSLELNGDILLSGEENDMLEKYTFSNAMALSVKLGIWEASLEKYIDTIEFVTEDLKNGKRISMTREEVLRKHGELFALRHQINLSSDLLDTPDFYWDREQLETLYSQCCAYYSIPRRTKVMNEKLNHCVELIELLSTHLSDRHHIRLEWMIIVLIMVEVAFEVIHYAERYLH